MPDPYMYAETSGRVRATELKSKALGKMLARADNALFVLASEVDEYPKGTLEEMIEKTDSTVYKTESSAPNEIDVEADARYGLMEILDILCDDEGEEYDMIVLAGAPYHIETRFLSGLRSCGVSNVITLDWRHQQYADFSYPNMDQEKWEKELKEVVSNL